MAKHRARKRFGQHFLSDPGIIDAIVRAVHPTADDVIVEIGPGQGAITDALARSAGHLHAVELDRDLVARLRRRYEDNPNVTVHEADALQFDFASLGDRIRVVGNLPYNISTPLLFHLLKFRSRILDMHFMLQKEVVDRMAASPGSKAYGRLGIMLGCHLNIESLFDVPREAFDPPPEVTSAHSCSVARPSAIRSKKAWKPSTSKPLVLTQASGLNRYRLATTSGLVITCGRNHVRMVA
jgi:16S rRNA (adenine1518-N6/adenine1519-N6)-dimethyltransferase